MTQDQAGSRLSGLIQTLSWGNKLAGITLVQAEAKLTEWLAADTAVTSGQSYTIGGRQLTRANVAEIRNNIDYWDAKVQNLSRGGIKIYGGTPT